MISLGRYGKTIVALVTGVTLWVGDVVASNPHAITSREWYELATVAGIALGVFSVSNAPASEG